MTVARIRLNGEWVNLYADEIKSRLKISSNLSDLSDVSTARENLELTGDVDTHHHDSRYLSLIENAVSENEENTALIEKETQERIDEDAKINAELDELADLHSKDISNLESSTAKKFADVDAKLQEIQNNILNNKTTVTKSTAGIAAADYKVAVTTSGSGSNIKTITTTSYLNTENGITAGSYDIATLLQKLTTLAHSHKITTSSSTSQCNCNCDCNSSCH